MAASRGISSSALYRAPKFLCFAFTRPFPDGQLELGYSLLCHRHLFRPQLGSNQSHGAVLCGNQGLYGRTPLQVRREFGLTALSIARIPQLRRAWDQNEKRKLPIHGPSEGGLLAPSRDSVLAQRVSDQIEDLRLEFST